VKRLLLDTHVALWLLVDETERVPDHVVETLEDERNQVALSAVSVWEIAIKRSTGKFTLEDGWAQRLSELGFDAMPVTALHAEAVEHLPWHHRDPFDRLLVAQASVERRTLVTADGRLAAYGVEVFW
jgi:PIN domain nuclease of toxin-antitoxin system